MPPPIILVSWLVGHATNYATKFDVCQENCIILLFSPSNNTVALITIIISGILYVNLVCLEVLNNT